MQEILKELIKTFLFKRENFQGQLCFLKFASGEVNKSNKSLWRKGKWRGDKWEREGRKLRKRWRELEEEEGEVKMIDAG